MSWARRLARAFGPKPKSVMWEDVALTTYRHLRAKRSWRDGAEDRIRAGASALDRRIGTERAILAIEAIVKAEILPEPPHA